MKTNKIAFLGMFTALAMIFSYIETLIPPLVAYPGERFQFSVENA